MARPPALSSAEVTAALAELPAWSGDTSGISRSADFPSMADAARAVVSIAELADVLDHHPDCDLRYRTVHLAVRTHDVGGVTSLDLQLAGQIDHVLDRPGQVSGA